MKKNRGYTLVEVVIAVGLMSMLVALLSQWYLQCYKLYTHFQCSIEANQNGRLALQLLVSNIRKQKSLKFVFDSDGKIISILDEYNKNIIDLRNDLIVGQSRGQIYYDRNTRELRSNKNGENTTLAWGVKEIEIRRNDQNILNISIRTIDKRDEQNVLFHYQLYYAEG